MLRKILLGFLVLTLGISAVAFAQTRATAKGTTYSIYSLSFSSAGKADLRSKNLQIKNVRSQGIAGLAKSNKTGIRVEGDFTHLKPVAVAPDMVYPVVAAPTKKVTAPKKAAAPALPPKIEAIYFDGQKWQPAAATKGRDFVIAEQPNISAKVTSSVGLDPSQPETLRIIIDGKSYSVKTSQVVKSAGVSGALTEVTVAYDFSASGEKLPSGKQSVTIKVTDPAGEASEVLSVLVSTGELRLFDRPVSYPSPVSLRTGKKVHVQYTLSKSADIDMIIVSADGQIVKKFSFPKGGIGGTVGRNVIPWDLIDDRKNLVGAGISSYLILDRNTRKILGRGKLTVIP